VVAEATPSVAACLRKKRRRLVSAVRRNRNADKRQLPLESAERRRSAELKPVASFLS